MMISHIRGITLFSPAGFAWPARIGCLQIVQDKVLFKWGFQSVQRGY